MPVDLHREPIANFGSIIALFGIFRRPCYRCYYFSDLVSGHDQCLLLFVCLQRRY